MEPTKSSTWSLFIDGLLGKVGSGAGIVPESLKGHRLNRAIRFGFKASNNSAEYEALLVCLWFAKEIQVKRFLVSSNLKLVISQDNGSCIAKDSIMVAYLKFVINLIPNLEKFELVQIPHMGKILNY